MTGRPLAPALVNVRKDRCRDSMDHESIAERGDFAGDADGGAAEIRDSSAIKANVCTNVVLHYR